jgi:hypothetical protein
MYHGLVNKMSKNIPVSLTALAQDACSDYAARWERIGFSRWVSKIEVAYFCGVTPERASDCLEFLFAKGRIQRRDRIAYGSPCGYEYHPLDKRKVTK